MTHSAYGLILVGCLFTAFYNTLSKRLQTEDWRQRSSAMVVLAQGGTSVLLFLLCTASGGLQIQAGFWLPALATGALNIGIMYGNMRARALEDVSLVTAHLGDHAGRRDPDQHGPASRIPESAWLARNLGPGRGNLRAQHL